MTTKQTGRPPSYSDQDLRSAIEAIETIGEQVTAEAVTKFFKEELGLKSKPRREPLHAKIEDFLAHRVDVTTDRNIRALPKDFRGSISILTANLEKEWLALGEPPLVFRRAFGSNVRLLFHVHSRFHRTFPPLLAA